MTQSQFAVFASMARWRFSKTYAKTFPHEYTLREWCDEVEFEAAVLAIRKYGIRKRFFRVFHIYFTCGGYEYWTMGAPLEETIVINRHPLKGYSSNEIADKLANLG